MKSRTIRAMVVAATVGTLALALAASSQVRSRSILFFQKDLSIYKVRLTPRHRPTRVFGTKTGPLAIAVAPGQVFWTTLGTSRATEFKSTIMAATLRGRAFTRSPRVCRSRSRWWPRTATCTGPTKMASAGWRSTVRT